MNHLEIVYEGGTTTAALLSRLLNDSDFVVWTLSRDFDARKHSFRTPLFLRACDPVLIEQVIELKNIGRDYAYYIDDNFWLIDDQTPLGRYYSNPTIRRSLAYLVENAKFVICHTEKFAAFLREFNSNVIILPTFFDFRLVPFEQKKELHPEEFRIGVVTNSSKDAEARFACEAAIRAIKRIPRKAVLEIIGYLPPGYEKHPSIRHFPATQNYSEFLKLQFSRAWDLGLAPLFNSKFSDFKTNNKYREYGGCEVAGIYSHCEVYKPFVLPSWNGWLIENDPEAWELAILHAFNHQNQLLIASQNSRRDVFDKFAFEPVQAIWIETLRKIEHRNNLLKKLYTKFTRKKKWKNSPLIIGRQSPKTTMQASIGNGSIEVVFSLAPNDSMACKLLPTYTGERKLTGIIATFQSSPMGMVEITELTELPHLQHKVHVYADISDGSHIDFFTQTTAGVEKTYRITNLSSGEIGFFLMKSSGFLIYSDGIEFRGSIFA